MTVETLIEAASQRLPVRSDWRIISDDHVRAFSALTGDPNYIHLDLEAVRERTDFDTTIAQGFFILSLTVGQTIEAIPGFPGDATWINYGLDQLRFTAPVPVGSEVRTVITGLDATPAGAGTKLRFTLHVEIKGCEKPALVASWLGLLT